MDTKKIVITGGPGTGKSSIINNLIERGFNCFEEISRQVTLDARKEGIEQLFLTKPLLFSEKLLEGRLKQFNDATNSKETTIFLDRGLPDVLAYMDYIGDTYPDRFIETCKANIYDHVFILAPWQEIFRRDSERYETFEQAILIHDCLLKTYKRFDYKLVDVPFGPIETRSDFIIDLLDLT